MSKDRGWWFDSDTVLLTDNEILIKAAQKNYDRFAVSVCEVPSTKVQRYYTTDQQADLDIKTSVNKIGEIVNLSQVLNSLYWDNVNHGESHEENFELYCDICTLNVLSGVEIDSAKKEFSIDRVKELKRIRDKYRPILTFTEEIEDPETHETKQKKYLVKPKFFEAVLRATGKTEYLKAGNKKYLVHETAMDYLESVARTHYQTQHKLPPFQPLSVMVNRDGYDNRYVRRPTIYNMVESVKTFLNYEHAIWRSSSTDIEERTFLIDQSYRELADRIYETRMSKSTMIWLLEHIFEYDADVSNLIINILFSERQCDFYNLLLESESPISCLQPSIQPDIELYGYSFQRVRR